MSARRRPAPGPSGVPRASARPGRAARRAAVALSLAAVVQGLGFGGAAPAGAAPSGSVPVAADRAGAHPSWSADPTPSWGVDSLPCRDVLFVGVRGSGEKAPWGGTVEGVRTILSEELDRPANQIWLDYPAVSPHTLGTHDLEAHVLDPAPPSSDYFDSVEEGSQELTRVLGQSARRCPGQQVLLVGFSQGAQVITRAVAGGADSSTLAGALLLGNPAHHPGQNAREVDGQVDTPAIGLAATLTYLRAQARPGDDTTRREAVHNLVDEVFALHEGKVSNGVIAGTLNTAHEVVPARLYSRILSVCSEGDLVCDAAPAMSRMLTSSSSMQDEFAAARPVHGGYSTDVVRTAAEELARLVGEAAAAPEEPSGPPPEPWVDPPPSDDPGAGPTVSPSGDAEPTADTSTGAGDGPEGGSGDGDARAAGASGETGPAWLVPLLAGAVGVLSLTTLGLSWALWRRR
ncbi:cutinase family protein [Kytococcus sedentarius]|uniref:cutinase family protein n=1 Tax=Kytococcus sedentarius TaxID=1276 RepID=UPI00145CDC7D|nr:cutinase family protein [Kytococcus sedentarius]QQB65010.1 cutinase family protein [Kytococcus sedentarius]